MLIRRVQGEPGLARRLASLLAECIEAGASVGFLLPVELDRLESFWTSVLEGASRGERLVLVAEDEATGQLCGTVQLVLAMPENQPHRAKVAKMLVDPRWRRRGIGRSLLVAAESGARSERRSLLVLDTADAGAERLYLSLGWRRVGVLPGFALLPGGGEVDTTIMFKRLEEPAP